MTKKMCAMSVRKLKPGSWNEFRAAWDITEHGGEHPPFVHHIYHVRSVNDPDLVVSFGIGEADELQAREWLAANADLEATRQAAIAETVAETLLDDRPDAETSARFLDVILGNARRMQRLVDSLLDLSRIESGSWSPRAEAIGIGAVTRETWAGLAARATQRRVELAVDADDPAPVEAHASIAPA